MSVRSKEVAMRVAETLRAMQDNLKCAVCLDTFREPVNTRCGHTFCQLCINQIVKGKNATCPLCNERVNRRSVTSNEKIENIVQALNSMILSAKKGLEDSGMENVFLLSKPRRPSSKESFSPSKLPTAAQPRKNTRVATWLEQVDPTSVSQEPSSSAVEEEPTPNDYSDSEMVSVSQINPDQLESTRISHNKPLSAHIEEDDVVNGSKSKVVRMRTKSLASKKTSSSKMKQNPIRGYISPLKQVPGPSPITLQHSKNLQDTSDLAIVVDPEEENTSNLNPSRSPGWSRVKEMKKEFHSAPKVLKTANSKGRHSPVPAIEDSGSGEEEPCLNLSLGSPMLKRKAIVNDIVNTLESEIEMCERSLQSVQSKTGSKVSSCKLPPVKPNNLHLFSDGCGESPYKPLVQFLKLGSVVTKRAPCVPIYLKGSLEHLHCIDVSSFAYRLLSDAQTQTEARSNVRMSPCPKEGASVKLIDQFLSPTQRVRISRGRRSSENNRDRDIDMMDAETVVLSQPALPDTERSLNTVANSPPLFNMEAAETLGPVSQQSQKSVSIICSSETYANPDDPKLSQLSASIIFSQGKESPAKMNNSDKPSHESSQRKSAFETTSHAIPQVNLNDSCSSIISEKKSKRGRALCSSSDSDTDVEISKEKVRERKKNRKDIISDNEDSCDNGLHITAGDTMEILANIEAQLEDTRNSSPEWSNNRKQSEPSGRTSSNLETVQVLGDTSTTQIDSDGDSEFINPTPQKQPSFTARSATQSDDIVPSSQPPFQLHGLVPSPEENTRGSHKNLSPSCKGSNGLSIGSAKKVPKERNISDSCNQKNTQVDEMQVDGKKASAKDIMIVKPVFVCSSISQNLAVQVDKLAHMVNGEFSPKFTPDTTHLIVRVDENNKADKTFKYLCAVAAGKWVVSYAWVQKCLDAKKLVPEEPFEALDASGEPGPRRSREARRSHKQLFDGFEFCCVGDFADLSKQQLQELLRQCGASVVPKPTDFSFQDHIRPLTVAQWDDSKEEEYNTWLDKYCTPLVQHDWVLDCIGKFCVTSFASMLICDGATDDVLARMGFPEYLYEFIDSEQ